MSDTKCIHGRTEKQACLACKEFNAADHETQRMLERGQFESVTIYHNNELGEKKWMYSVSIADDYWLNSFKTLKAAKAFIKRHKLKYTEK